MSARDDLALVVQLACLTEDRTNQEQHALLRTAAGLDNLWNSPLSHPRDAHRVRGAPTSLLLLDVERTRVYDNGREARLPPKDRAKWERKVAAWELFAAGGNP